MTTDPPAHTVMKHIQISILLSISLLLTVSSCGQQQAWDGGLISVQYDRLPQGEDFLLSDWVGEPEFIALDSDTLEAITNGNNIAISDHYIGIYSDSEECFKLFDRATGKFLRNIGNIGRGPGEYRYISMAQIDESCGRIWISTKLMNKIYSYDIQTGKLSEDIPLAYKSDGSPNQGYAFMVDSLSKTITIADVPFDNGCPVIAWCQDYKGNVLWEIPKTRTIAANPMLCINTMLNVKGTLDICYNSMNTQHDTLFAINDEKVQPLLTVDFGEVTAPGRLNISEGYYLHNPYILTDYIVMTINRIETTDSKSGSNAHIFITTSTQPSVVMDRRTGEVSRRNFTNDFMAKNESNPTFRDGYMVDIYSASYFLETGYEALENGNLSSSARKRISDILENISEDDNNVIILAPLK